jgi:NADPH-dependent ferric siderophore reductase
MTISAFARNEAAGLRIERVRHELKVRSLKVESAVRLTPGMLRITLSGEDLSDFVSLAPDDHVKIFAPTVSGAIVRRDYTPRRFDPQARTLAIDFAVHDAGPATQWALHAQPGDGLQIGGPRGSAVVRSDIRRWLLIGDETALPAIGRRIEEANEGAEITSIVAVSGPDERQAFDTRAEFAALWAYRPLSAAADPEALLALVKTMQILPGTFIWVAAESAVARAIRSHLVEDRGYPRSWIKASGYWVMGKADAHEKFE